MYYSIHPLAVSVNVIPSLVAHLTYPPQHFVGGEQTAHNWNYMSMFSVFCHLSRHLVSGRILSRHVSPSQLWSASISLSIDHLLSSVISFSWPHLYLAFAHVQTISTSSLWGILPSGTCVPLSRCLHFSHDLLVVVFAFLLPTATCTFQLCAISSPPSF